MKSNPIKKSDKRGGRRPGSGRRPGAKNKVTLALKEMASKYTETALNVLVEIMQDPEAPHVARVSAANGVLDRGHGKPTQSVDETVTVQNGMGPEMIKRLETDMLERMERARQRQLAVLEERRHLFQDDV
jgi:hypothetical protein